MVIAHLIFIYSAILLKVFIRAFYRWSVLWSKFVVINLVNLYERYHFIFSEMEAKKKVCIVGGGPSGLAALRRVLESPVLTGTLFEQKEDIGGLWQYESVKKYHTSPKLLAGTSGSCQNPAEVTSMYDGLR